MQNKGINTRVSHTQSPDKQNRWLWPAIILAAAILLVLLLAGSTSSPPPVQSSAGHGLQKPILKTLSHPSAHNSSDEYFPTPASVILSWISIGFQVTVLPIINGIIKRGIYGSRSENYSSQGHRLVGLIKNGLHRMEHILPAELAVAHCSVIFSGFIQCFHAFLSLDILFGILTPCVTCSILLTDLPFSGFMFITFYVQYLVISEEMGFLEALRYVREMLQRNPKGILFLGARRTIALIFTPYIAVIVQIPLVVFQSLWNTIYRSVMTGQLPGYIPRHVSFFVSGLFAGMYLLIQIAANYYMTHLMFKQHRVSAPAHTGAHLE